MKFNKILIALVFLFSLLSVSYAAPDFTVTSTGTSVNANIGDNVQFNVTVENTGDEVLNLSVASLTLSSGANSKATTLSQSSILNLAVGASQVITINSASAFTNVGTYTGSLMISDDNASNTLNRTIALSATIIDPESIATPTISLPSEITVGDNVQVSVGIRNDGSVDLTNIGVNVQIPSLSLSESYTIANLATGSTDSNTVTLSIPSSATFGNNQVQVDVTYGSSKTSQATEAFFLAPNQTVFFEGFTDEVVLEVDLDDDTDRDKLTLVNAYNTEITDIIFELRTDIDDFEPEKHIEFEDSGEDKLDVDEDDKDEEFELGAGDSYTVSFDFKNLDEIAVKDHTQSNALTVKYNVVVDGSSVSRTESFDVRIRAEKETVDVKFREREIDVTVERGDNVDIDLEIKNDEEFDVDNITVIIGDDFELKTDSSEDLSSSQFDFEESSAFEVKEGTEDFTIEFESNDNDDIGTYEGTIIIEYKGDEIDEIPVTIRITDGVFIKSITPKTKAIPDETLKVDVLIENDDKTQNIKVTGRINNVNSFGTDLVDSENVLIAKGNSEVVQLNYKIPDDVKSNDLLIEVTVEYEDPEDEDDIVEFVEEEEIMVDRKENKIDIINSFASPNVISCSATSVQSKITFKNVGSNEEEVKVSARVLGTTLSSNTVTYDIFENAQDSFTYIIPTSDLAAGDYEVEFKLTYDNGILSETQKVRFEKEKCSEDSTGIKPTNPGSNVDNNGNIIIPGTTGGDDSTDNSVTDSEDESTGLDTLTITLIVIVSILLILTIIVLLVVLL